MGLPKIQQPLFEIILPSTDKKVTYRPFTVKEEKILLIAKESKDINQGILAIKQIITNCVQGVDVDKLAMFDIEYLLINIRAKSVSNELEFGIIDPVSGEEIQLKIDIDDIKVMKNKNHSKLIKLDNDLTLHMKYPTIDQIRGLANSQPGEMEENLFNILIACIDTVVQGDSVYKLSDFSELEVLDFVNSLTSNTVDKIKDFFNTMPVLRFEKKYKLKDGTEKTFVAEGTETFFI